MDMTNPEEWKQQWTTFTSAPYIMLSPMVIAGLVGWWLQGTKSAGKIAGLEEKISVYEQRLKLAVEQSAASDRAKDEAEKELQTFKGESR